MTSLFNTQHEEMAQLCSTQTFMDTKMQISYDFHVPSNRLLLLIDFQPHKNVKGILGSRLTSHKMNSLGAGSGALPVCRPRPPASARVPFQALNFMVLSWESCTGPRASYRRKSDCLVQCSTLRGSFPIPFAFVPSTNLHPEHTEPTLSTLLLRGFLICLCRFFHTV